MTDYTLVAQINERLISFFDPFVPLPEFHGVAVPLNELQPEQRKSAQLKYIRNCGMGQFLAGMEYVGRELNISKRVLIPRDPYPDFDLEIASNLLDTYEAVCNSYNKEVTIYGFCKFSGIPYEDTYKGSKSETVKKFRELTDACKIKDEQSLQGLLVSGYRQPLAIIATLNRHYNWMSPVQKTEDVKLVSASELLASLETSKAGKPALPDDIIAE